jgi:hypothetical protein
MSASGSPGSFGAVSVPSPEHPSPLGDRRPVAVTTAAVLTWVGCAIAILSAVAGILVVFNIGADPVARWWTKSRLSARL